MVFSCPFNDLMLSSLVITILQLLKLQVATAATDWILSAWGYNVKCGTHFLRCTASILYCIGWESEDRNLLPFFIKLHKEDRRRSQKIGKIFFIDQISDNNDLIYGIIKKLRFCENTTKMKWVIILRQKTKTFQFNQNVTLKRQEVFTFSEWEKG